MAAKLWTILALLATSQAVRGSGVILSNNPNVIQTIITQEMAMKCSIDTTGGGDLKFVTSLVITRDGIQVASITPFAPVAVFTDQGKLNATGHVSTQNGADGELSLIWNYPDEGQAGNYTCDVNGVNSVGHPVSYTAVVNVPVRQPTLADITLHVRDQQILINQLNVDNIALKLDNLSQEKDITSLQTDMIAQKNGMANLSTSNILMSNKLDEILTALDETRHVENGTLVFGASSTWTDVGDYMETNLTETFNIPYGKIPVVHVAPEHVFTYNSNSNFAYSLKYWLDLLEVNVNDFTLRVRTEGVSTSYLYFNQFDVSWISVGQSD